MFREYFFCMRHAYGVSFYSRAKGFCTKYFFARKGFSKDRKTVSQTVSDRVVNRPSDQTALKKPSKIFYQNSLYSHHLTVLQNNFSIRTDTQLCGVTRALSIEIGVMNYPQPLMTGDKCVQNACFDTQTGTYITADGTRSVCR